MLSRVSHSLAFFLIVVMATMLLAGLEGISSVFLKSTQSTSIIIEAKMGDDIEELVTIPAEISERIKSILQGGEIVSQEYLDVLTLRQPDGGIQRVTIRGVDAGSYKIHGKINVIQGRLPVPKELGLVVGKHVLHRIEGAQIGDKIAVGGHMWPIIGVLDAPETIFQSEVWCDRLALMSEMGKTSLSGLYLNMDWPGNSSGILAKVAVLPNIVVQPEREHYQNLLKLFFTKPKLISRIIYTTILYLWIALIVCLLSTNGPNKVLPRLILNAKTALLGGVSAGLVCVGLQAVELNYNYRTRFTVFSPHCSVRVFLEIIIFLLTSVLIATLFSVPSLFNVASNHSVKSHGQQ